MEKEEGYSKRKITGFEYMIQHTSNDYPASKDIAHVRVKITHSRENKIKGFYLLMTNGDTYSDKQDEFIIETKLLKLLDDIKLPLNQEV